MNVLGIDPGIRNTGLYFFGNGKPRRFTLRCAKTWPFERCLEWICFNLTAWIGDADVVAVEEVVWRRRRGMLPLAHVAGAAVALGLAAGKTVYLLTPAQKGDVGRTPKGWTQHEVDARALARIAYQAETVPSAATASVQRRRLRTSAGGPVPSVVLKPVRGGGNQPNGLGSPKGGKNGRRV